MLDIQHQLHETASVIESAMLPDREGGDEAEIDILIEGKLGDYPIRVGVECIDHKRPADTPWVREQWAKHQNRTDRLVLVSRSGFYEPAIRYAEERRIICLTLRDATSLDWQKFVGKLQDVLVGVVSYTPLGVYLIVDQSGTPKTYKARPNDLIFAVNLETAEGKAWTVGSIVNTIVQHPDFGLQVGEWIHAQPDLKWGRFENEFTQDVYIKDSNDVLHRLLAIRFDVSWSAQYTPMRLNPGTLADLTGGADDVSIAWGHAETPDEQLDLVVTEREQGGFRGRLRVTSSDGSGSQLGTVHDVSDYKPTKFRMVEAQPDDFL